MKRHPNLKDLKTANLSTLTPIQQVNMLPDKIALFDNIKGLGLEAYTNLQAVILVLVKQGTAKIELNLQTYNLESNHLLFIMPNQIIKAAQSNSDLDFFCIACSPNMIEDILSRMEDSIPLILKIKDAPLVQLPQNDFDKLYKSSLYLKEKFKNSENNKHRLLI